VKRLNVVDEIVPDPATGTDANPDAAAPLAEIQRKRLDRVVR
jgi:hypothetical protein